MSDALATTRRRDFESEVNAVLRHIRRWRIRLHLGTPPNHVGFHEGPIAGGIHWPSRAIWWPPDEDAHELSACALLHELSHILVDEDPETVDEIGSAMLAFERASMRVLKLPWSTWMANFSLGGIIETTWNELTTRERGELLADSKAKAVGLGLLTTDGRLTFTPPHSLHPYLSPPVASF